MILAKIGSWLLGGGISAIGKQINEHTRIRADAQNATERVEADKVLAGLEARRSVLVAEAKGNWNVAFRAILAAPFALFVWKVIVYDKLLGMGVTDPLSPELWNLMIVVYGFYFVYETAALFKR